MRRKSRTGFSLFCIKISQRKFDSVYSLLEHRDHTHRSAYYATTPMRIAHVSVGEQGNFPRKSENQKKRVWKECSRYGLSPCNYSTTTLTYALIYTLLYSQMCGLHIYWMCVVYVEPTSLWECRYAIECVIECDSSIFFLSATGTSGVTYFSYTPLMCL